MVRLHVRFENAPTSFEPYGAIRLVHQSRKEYVEGKANTFALELDRKLDRSGELQWSGDAVHYHGDKRRFIYFAWLSESGKMFRRIKLYLDKIPGLESSEVTIRVAGRMKDGSPACSTARILSDKE